MRALRTRPRPRAAAAAAAAVALLLLPSVAEAACDPLAPRPGAEVVNPFVQPYAYSAANSNPEAYRRIGLPPNASVGSLGTPAAAFEYLQFEAADDLRWQTDESAVTGELEVQVFVFFVSPALVNASSLTLVWQGYGAFRRPDENTYLLAYNHNLSRWDIIANTSFSFPVDSVVRGEIARNVSHYLAGTAVTVAVASEEGPFAELGNVGRPGGPPNPTTVISTNYVELDAFLPATVAALDIPLSINSTTFPQVTFRGPSVIVEGDITVRAGATLTLDHARITMNGTISRVLVEPGGSLRLLNGSVLTDSAADTDDGGPGDLAYAVQALDGAEFEVRDSVVENAGVPGGGVELSGVYLRDVQGSVCSARIEGRGTVLALDRVANLSLEDARVDNQGAGPFDLQLLNESRVDALGLNFTGIAISPDSLLTVRTAVTVEVADGSGKPIRGVDLEMTDDGAVIYASPGFGGADPQTARATDFDDRPLPNTLRAVNRVYAGSVTPALHTTVISAKYFGWSESRNVSTGAPHTERFTMALPAPPFADRAAAWGYDQVPRNYSVADSYGPGVALADYDRDGMLDVFVAGGASRGEAEGRVAEVNRLYRQSPAGRFVDVTATAGLSSGGATAAAWGDFDNDGDADLYLVYTGFGTSTSLLWPGAANALYRNNGDGTFANVTSAAGVGDTGHGTSAAWGDFDGDGWLDLYVGNAGWVLGWLVRNETNTLYRNNRDGSFTDVTAALGVTGGGPGRSGALQQLTFFAGDNATPVGLDSPAGSGFTQAVAWFDYDRDGDLDLFAANEFGSSVLYRNGGGTFTVATEQAGLRKVGSARGVQVLDINNDGWLDIMQANRWVDFVWRNNGDGTFTDIAGQLGLDEELPGTVPVPLDLDLDGDLDLFVGGGRTTSFHAFAPSFLWENRGGGRFADITASAGVATGDNRTMGAASADLDGDGLPDLITANADRRGSLFLNGGAAGSWLKVRLVGVASPRDAQGAQVVLVPWSLARTLGQQVGGVGARGSQQPGELLFGLAGLTPSPAAPWQLTVYWPSGIRQSLSVTQANVVIEVHEGSAVVVDPPYPLRFVTPEDTELQLAVTATSTDPRLNATAAVEWSLNAPGGNVTLSGFSPRHTFATPGRFFGNVTVRTRTGEVASALVEVTVLDTTPPVIGALADLDATAGVGVVMDAAQAADNDPAFAATGNFTWSFVEGGAQVTRHGAVVEHAFAAPGDYIVTLTVRDAANLTASATFTVRVAPAPGIGLREVAVGALVALAGLVAAAALFTARKRAREGAQAERREGGEGRRGEPAEGVRDSGEPKRGGEPKSRKRLR